MRDKLIELINENRACPEEDGYPCEKCVYDTSPSCFVDRLADVLIANGVIVPPVKVGQTVWLASSLHNKAYERRVEQIDILYTLDTKSQWSSVEAQGVLFPTKEAAEAALKERVTDGR